MQSIYYPVLDMLYHLSSISYIIPSDHRSVSLNSELISCPFTTVVKHASKSFRCGDLWKVGCVDIVKYAVGHQFIGCCRVSLSRDWSLNYTIYPIKYARAFVMICIRLVINVSYVLNATVAFNPWFT